MLWRCLREVNGTSESIQYATVLHHSSIVVGQSKEYFGGFAFQVCNGGYPDIPQIGCKRFPIPGITVSSLIVCSLVIALDKLQDKISVSVNLPKRVVGYLEHIAVQILEIAAVSSSIHFLCRFHNGCSEPLCFLHHGIDFLFRYGVITDCHARKGSLLMV